MTGISIFLIGSVALTNVGLLLYLMADRKVRHTSDPPDSKEKQVDDAVSVTESTAPEQSDPAPSIGKSKTDPNKLAAEYALRFKKLEELEQKVDRTFQLMEQFIGDVREKDVEFAKEPDQPETVAKEEPARMSKEQEEVSFEDVRIDEFDSDTVSAPSAAGASMDEIEESFNTVRNHAAATPEQKAKAGRIIDSLADTFLMDMLNNNDVIREGIKACFLEKCRMDISGKATGKVKAIKHEKTTVILSKDFKDFNLSDYL